MLYEPDIPTGYVYFPTTSFISLVARMAHTPGLEVGMVGSEGMLGVQLALGMETAPLHALVQGAGAAWRAPAPAFRKELARNDALQRCLQRYMYVLMGQLATAAPCLRFHPIEPRLARWLLMSQDRAHEETFEVTHEFLAYMLGVRRAGVSVAASGLKTAGLIEYHRGFVTVLDRKGLEAAACDCYARDRAAYSHAMAGAKPARRATAD